MIFIRDPEPKRYHFQALLRIAIYYHTLLKVHGFLFLILICMKQSIFPLELLVGQDQPLNRLNDPQNHQVCLKVFKQHCILYFLCLSKNYLIEGNPYCYLQRLIFTILLLKLHHNDLTHL